MTRKKNAAPIRPRVKPTHDPAPNASAHLCQLWLKTSDLVQRLIQTLEDGVSTPEVLPEHWERLFGPKDSAVVNLQKLVAVLALVSERLMSDMCGNADAAHAELTQPPMQAEDLEMLMRWAESELVVLKPSAAAPGLQSIETARAGSAKALRGETDAI